MKRTHTILILVTALILFLTVSLGIGQIDISFIQILNSVWDQNSDNLITDVIVNLRLPRLLFAVLSGAGLALCGYIMQAAIQNPLADPYVLGISSGASLGASLAIVLNISLGSIIGNNFVIALFAFLGSLVTMVLVMFTSNYRGNPTTERIILSGVIANSLCVALTNLMMYLAKDAESIRNITFWTMGSLSNISWIQVFLVAISTLGAIVFFLTQYRSLNLISLGDEAAASLGVNVRKRRNVYILAVTFLTGVIVSQCGIIGFVGLIVPHSVRMACKTSNSNILPIILLSGSIFMLFVDTLSRSILNNQEIPIGIITSLIGAPVFLFIFIKRK
ncbi:iron ABC transporter permease [Arenibacter sp. M-2]|uniref:FecCD family ABC transporter permease n=1 Tax=Arenibacter sp. M-2 TaxID=3053612 RepID=UPI00256FCD7B|nr:iron ABC transporter permease [Arenibacter sp. M-2]MDL5512468.1 iron ABC transporter permease [Arenibacter sp. M-2]